jgi:beta-galactosidase
VDVVDRAGVIVPSADNPISFTVTGGSLVGLDNGRQESAENYTSHTREAFNGKALAIVQAGDRAGPITITARTPGLPPARTTVRTGNGNDNTSMVDSAVEPAPLGPTAPSADASFSGAPATIPAAVLDGNLATGWSNFYNKSATALLPTISKAHASEWVSVSLPQPRTISAATAYFTLDAARALPATIDVSYWNDRAFVPVGHPVITWATASNQPTTITFDPVRSTSIRLELTSRSPNTATGFLQIAELQI